MLEQMGQNKNSAERSVENITVAPLYGEHMHAALPYFNNILMITFVQSCHTIKLISKDLFFMLVTNYDIKHKGV